jgi:hypothetical protein
MIRFGGRYTIGRFRADLALMFGVASPGPGVGWGGGFTYVFDGFSTP